MINFSVGNKWENNFIDKIVALNIKYSALDVRVNELYGSLHESIPGLQSARPNYRLPDISNRKFENFIHYSHQNNLKVNYTINAPLVNSVSEIYKNKDNIINKAKWLVDCGVDILTVANSLLIEIILEEVEIPIEVSSLLHIGSVSQIEYLKNNNVTGICLDVNKNRDISFLSKFNKIAVSNNIKPKLLVNEFCNFNGAPCSGIQQADCVAHSSLGGNDDSLFDGWPFKKCGFYRKELLSTWLKSKFILPQWLNKYKDNCGINNFKITGRTCDTNWLLSTIEFYMSLEYNSDIRDLWVDPGEKYFDNFKNSSEPYLLGSYLDDVNYIEHWFNNPEFRCNESCGVECNFCDDICKKTALKNPLSKKIYTM